MIEPTKKKTRPTTTLMRLIRLLTETCSRFRATSTGTLLWRVLSAECRVRSAEANVSLPTHGTFHARRLRGSALHGEFPASGGVSRRECNISSHGAAIMRYALVSEQTSVIIVGWQVRDLLRACLASIAAHED